MSYVAQKPWLLNGTVEKNIIFGSSAESARLARVVAACALGQDLDPHPGLEREARQDISQEPAFQQSLGRGQPEMPLVRLGHRGPERQKDRQEPRAEPGGIWDKARHAQA